MLDLDPENARAYLGKLMVELCVHTPEQLKECERPFYECRIYQKVERFADSELRAQLKEYADYLEQVKLKSKYSLAVDMLEEARKARNEKKAVEASAVFESIGEYRDSEALAKQCKELAGDIRCDGVFKEIQALIVKNSVSSLTKAIGLLQSISDYRDVDSLLEECRRKLDERQRAERNDTFSFYGDSEIDHIVGVKNLKLRELTIPSFVTKIDQGAFANCTELESITVDGENPNYHCQNNCLIETHTQTLIAAGRNFRIPADGSVVRIGEKAFCGRRDTSTFDIKLPEGIKYIGEGAFSYCDKLKSVSFPSSLLKIGNYAFLNCYRSRLTSGNLGSSL